MQWLWLEVNVINARKCMMFQKIILKKQRIVGHIYCSKMFSMFTMNTEKQFKVFSTYFSQHYTLFLITIHFKSLKNLLLTLNKIINKQILHLTSTWLMTQTHSSDWCYISDVASSQCGINIFDEVWADFVSVLDSFVNVSMQQQTYFVLFRFLFVNYFLLDHWSPRGTNVLVTTIFHMGQALK